MGCDIHIHAEVKINGKWEHYAQPDCDRDYELFEKMAGVRGNVKKAIAAPRGLPRDATRMTKFDAKQWGSDAHSHSWLNAKEIYQLAEWEGKRNKANLLLNRRWDQWLFSNSYSGFVRYPHDRPEGLQDVRFIFWFDN